MKNNREQLIKEYVKIAKRANKRLYNLEKLSNEKNFEIVKDWSYKRALHDINTWNKGHKRFKTSNLDNINLNTLSAMRNDVYNFLNSKSSTKSGIVKLYKEKTETFNKKYNLNWSWKDTANFFENGGLKEKFDKMDFASSTTLDIIAVIRKNPEQMKKVIDEFNKKHKYNKNVEKEVSMLKDNNGIIDKKNFKYIINLLTENDLKVEDLL